MTRAQQARVLATALEVYCAHHGLATSRVGVHLFGGARNGIAQLRTRKSPHERTLARVREFLKNPPPPGLHRRPLGGPRKRRDCSTGILWAERIEAMIAAHDLSPHRVSMHLFHSNHGIERLRTLKPQKRTVERVKAFLAAPDIAAMRRQIAAPKVKRAVFVAPVREQRRRTFEEVLALVESGKARIAPKLVLPTHGYDRTLGGVSAGML